MRYANLALLACLLQACAQPQIRPAAPADRCILGRLDGLQRGALSATVMTLTHSTGHSRELSAGERSRLECKGAKLADVLADAQPPAELLISY